MKFTTATCLREGRGILISSDPDIHTCTMKNIKQHQCWNEPLTVQWLHLLITNLVASGRTIKMIDIWDNFTSIWLAGSTDQIRVYISLLYANCNTYIVQTYHTDAMIGRLVCLLIGWLINLSINQLIIINKRPNNGSPTFFVSESKYVDTTVHLSDNLSRKTGKTVDPYYLFFENMNKFHYKHYYYIVEWFVRNEKQILYFWWP